MKFNNQKNLYKSYPATSIGSIINFYSNKMRKKSKIYIFEGMTT